MTYNKEAKAKYYETNKERILERTRKYYETNKEAIKEAHKDTKVERARENYKANREVYLEKFRKYYKDNRETRLECASKYRESHKVATAERNLKRLYGVTRDRKTELFKLQGNKCKCCSTSDPSHKHGWAVDHDHITESIRGVICHKCNTNIGRLGDHYDHVLSSVAKYGAYLSSTAQNQAKLENVYSRRVIQKQTLLEQQGHSCRCCDIYETKRWVLDHDHNTQIIRGVICSACNTAIGHLGDTLEKLEKRAQMYLTYLEPHRRT